MVVAVVKLILPLYHPLLGSNEEVQFVVKGIRPLHGSHTLAGLSPFVFSVEEERFFFHREPGARSVRQGNRSIDVSETVRHRSLFPQTVGVALTEIGIQSDREPGTEVLGKFAVYMKCPAAPSVCGGLRLVDDAV